MALSHVLRDLLCAVYALPAAAAVAARAHAGATQQRVQAGWYQWQIETQAATQSEADAMAAEQRMAQAQEALLQARALAPNDPNFAPLLQARALVEHYQHERDREADLAKKALDVLLTDLESSAAMAAPISTFLSTYLHAPQVRSGWGRWTRVGLGLLGHGALADRMRQEHLAHLAHEHLSIRAHHALGEAQAQLDKISEQHPAICVARVRIEKAKADVEKTKDDLLRHQRQAGTAKMRLREALHETWLLPEFLDAVREAAVRMPLPTPAQPADPPQDADAMAIGAWAAWYFTLSMSNPETLHFWHIFSGRAHLSEIPGWEWLVLSAGGAGLTAH